MNIAEDYGTYEAPAWVRHVVERLLASVPPGQLRGLSSVVLTDSNRSRQRRDGRRQRANKSRDVLGSYHQEDRGEPARIELVVDEILSTMPARGRWLGGLRDQAIGRVLFHEIGHHVHQTLGSAGRDPESGAEAVRRKLQRDYMRATYWYLRPVAPLLRRLLRVLQALRRQPPSS